VTGEWRKLLNEERNLGMIPQLDWRETGKPSATNIHVLQKFRASEPLLKCGPSAYKRLTSASIPSVCHILSLVAVVIFFQEGGSMIVLGFQDPPAHRSCKGSVTVKIGPAGFWFPELTVNCVIWKDNSTCFILEGLTRRHLKPDVHVITASLRLHYKEFYEV
jgi:hypothetical protein